ncbi:MAG: ribosome maturation factor RimP [Lachnospiraceae bacterium]|nr:ribosome maturation factor RimP [Lachnospiraceae bacterium]
MTQKHEIYEEKTAALAEPVLRENGLTLYDVEYVKEAGGYILRLYLEKESGVTIDDCVTVSRALSDLLDEADFIPDAYTLEVQSLGLGRALKKDKDFRRNVGRTVEIRLYKPVDKGLRELSGVLKAFDQKTVTIETEEGETLIIEKKNLSLIREYVDWNA